MFLLNIFLSPVLTNLIDSQVDFNSLSENIASTVTSLNETISAYNNENGTSFLLLNENLMDSVFVNNFLHS